MDIETVRRLHHISDPPKMPNPWLFILGVIVMLVVIVIIFSSLAYPQPATEGINIERLVTAIYYAEGGAKTRHPYGILAKYKHTTPRQACINTIKSGLRRYTKSNQRLDFITFLGLTYCPIGAANDPRGLNKNWVRNVKYFYGRIK